MRLRELGSTQSIVFFAPPEVHQSIHDVCHLGAADKIDSSHVVTWLLEQTCRANEQLQALHLAQGQDYCRRVHTECQNPQLLTNTKQRDTFVRTIRQPERQTLEELYGGMARPTPDLHLDLPPSGKLREFAQELAMRQDATHHRGGRARAHDSALEEVEQEREVEVQVEEVREKQEPREYEALKFPRLHDDIRRFVKTGVLSGQKGYRHAFEAIAGTSIGKRYNVGANKSLFFVSVEYMRTIVPGASSENDDFLVRPHPPSPFPLSPLPPSPLCSQQHFGFHGSHAAWRL
jgi:hypothetical protein